MTANVAAALSLAGVILAVLVPFAIARRRNSGRIGTTEADRLWTEAEKLRDFYRAEMNASHAEVVRLGVDLAATRHELEQLRTEGAVWRVEAAELRAETALLRAEAVTFRKARDA